MTWAFTLASLAGNYLNCRKRVAGFYIWILCNMAWLGYDIMSGIYSRAVLDIVQTAFCIYGIRHWSGGETHGKRKNVADESQERD